MGIMGIMDIMDIMGMDGDLLFELIMIPQSSICAFCNIITN